MHSLLLHATREFFQLVVLEMVLMAMDGRIIVVFDESLTSETALCVKLTSSSTRA